MTEINAFINRLNKNAKHLIKWAQRENITAWRLYDRDIPQFPLAIDIYNNHIHLQEYDTGWVLSEHEYNQWVQQIIEAICLVTGFHSTHIHFKKRIRQKGHNQYEKTGQTGEDFIITENGRKFWVNLDKYLDTGLFLDHRNTRKHIGNIIKNKRFLNLFAYTGSFSVYAITGGAIYSETVDLSNTYLDWAQRNFQLNHITPQQHHIIRADVFQYLQTAIHEKKQFDIIVMDPPSFSNSKKMQHILDIQRDHPYLITQAVSLLSPQGQLYFSTNLKNFILDESLTRKYKIRNISKQSVPLDFRNKKIHQCWIIEPNNDEQ